eukprot:TRINITY_DN17133_c0_g1_i1.p1 TRINITY_DN17133_c0_g1~~TRINITY_DN17133_c0_g1_i1.p1  ORF type:complete len:327 (+),score=13.06 TRINITY_DN17133_c0_g1_i1:54-1034(+)
MEEELNKWKAEFVKDAAVSVGIHPTIKKDMIGALVANTEYQTLWRENQLEKWTYTSLKAYAKLLGLLEVDLLGDSELVDLIRTSINLPPPQPNTPIHAGGENSNSPRSRRARSAPHSPSSRSPGNSNTPSPRRSPRFIKKTAVVSAPPSPWMRSDIDTIKRTLYAELPISLGTVEVRHYNRRESGGSGLPARGAFALGLDWDYTEATKEPIRDYERKKKPRELKRIKEGDRRKLLRNNTAVDLLEVRKNQRESIQIRNSREKVGCSCVSDYKTCATNHCGCFKNRIPCHEGSCSCSPETCKNPQRHDVDDAEIWAHCYDILDNLPE